jgi:hypothetical protein
MQVGPILIWKGTYTIDGGTAHSMHRRKHSGNRGIRCNGCEDEDEHTTYLYNFPGFCFANVHLLRLSLDLFAARDRMPGQLLYVGCDYLLHSDVLAVLFSRWFIEWKVVKYSPIKWSRIMKECSFRFVMVICFLW